MTSFGEGGTFQRFLHRLSPEPDAAGRAYEQLRRALHHYFTNRGCGSDVDALVDVALDRLAVKVAADSTEKDSIRALAYGIARYVGLEHSRRPKTVALSAEPLAPAIDISDSEHQSACLNSCLMRLSDADRDLITEYYEYDGRQKVESRRRSAGELDVTSGAFRVRLWKLRQKLRKCIERCLQQTRGE
jgi:DNA-directed RNA polymerase specialized sigma24 family protein